jgi:hypothetical protein
MSDSENLVGSTQPSPDGTTAIVVRTPSGKEKILLKDKGGRFARKKRPMPDGREIKRQGRKILMGYEAGPDGKMTRGSKAHFERTVETAIMWANYRPPQGEKPDPKMVAASKQWADWLWLNFVGKPSETDEDKEDNKLAGVKFVVIQQPELMHKEVLRIEDRKQPDKPTFIDAEIITNE